MGLSIWVAAIEVGGYVSWIKALPVVVLVLIWTRLLTWIDKDTEVARLPRVPVNMGMMSGLVLMLGAFFLLPAGFIVLFPILILVIVMEIGAYLFMRQKTVGLHDLSTEFKTWVRSFGGKPKEVKEVADTVQLVGARGELLPAPAHDAPEYAAYVTIQKMLTDPMENHAELIDFSPGEGGGQIKYMVDGVVYNGSSAQRADAGAAIARLKALAGMDVKELRKPQTGTFRVSVNGKRFDVGMLTKGSTAGEYMRLTVNPKARHSFQLDRLGFPDEQLAIIRESIATNKGLVLVATPRGMGLTSLLYGLLRGHDAFLQHLITVEREPEDELEGITQNSISANPTAEEEYKQITWTIDQQPDVMMVSKLDDAKSAAALSKAAAERRIYVGMVAGSVFDTLAAWRKLAGDDRVAMQNLSMIICGRTLRKLCAACKVSYTPDPETLRKLNMDPASVDKLFQARREPLHDAKGNPMRCTFCNDLRFKGRTGIYEIFVIDDDVKATVMAGGTANQLRQVFRKQRARLMQEMGLALVEQGETSVQEVLRVMKIGAAAAGGESGGGGRASAPRPAPAG